MENSEPPPPPSSSFFSSSSYSYSSCPCPRALSVPEVGSHRGSVYLFLVKQSNWVKFAPNILQRFAIQEILCLRILFNHLSFSGEFSWQTVNLVISHKTIQIFKVSTFYCCRELKFTSCSAKSLPIGNVIYISNARILLFDA